ncbi:hypothetical protein HYU23_01205 [Candidatus Woesearchaeota archaeon]|nr:hypothetical protein [Candidatus Woesearchaeota archaeon]
MKERKIVIHPITEKFYRNLSKLKNWEETKLVRGQAVKIHKHKFDAMYFTSSVKTLYNDGEKIDLPEFAAVFIPKEQEHGWGGANREIGIVGHFHEGHGIHAIVPEY